MIESEMLGVYKENVKIVLDECGRALEQVDENTAIELLHYILSAEKVFVIGVGRVMLSLQAMAKRLAHLGIDTYCVGQITEPAITDRDLLIVGSGSGESLIPVAIAKKAKALGAKVAHIGSNPQGSLSRYTDVFLRIPVCTKLSLPDEIHSLQPMTSLFEQSLLLFADALAMMVIYYKKIDIANLWRFHANLE